MRRDAIKIAVSNPSGPAKVTHGAPDRWRGRSGPARRRRPRCRISDGSSRSRRARAGSGSPPSRPTSPSRSRAAGRRVGLMDADVYGPNIPRMFGVSERPPVVGGKIQPLEAHGVKLMSLGFLVERDAPAIWRGPIIMKIVQQFLRDVEWGALDYFLVDLPPGHRRRAALAGAGHARLRRADRHHAAGDGGRRRAPRRPDVRAGRRAGPRHRGEHERVRGSGERAAASSSSPPAADGDWPRSSGWSCSAASRCSRAWPSWPTAGSPILVAEPESAAATELLAIADQLQRKTAGRSAALPILRG